MEAAGNLSHPSWQNNMGPLTLVDTLGEIIVPVQIMGIIHYLFIADQECENAYLSLARKNDKCDYMDSEIYACLNTSGGYKLCKVNKPYHSFSSKLFE